jgi:hypothetical protein
MDIGYGSLTALPILQEKSIVDALWRFFIDAGGFPKCIHCHFDKHLIQDNVGRLLAANGAVERCWNTAYKMRQAFLAEAQLRKHYWFWAIRTAIQRMNMLPCRNPDLHTDADDARDFAPINNVPDKAGRRAFLYTHLATSALQ